MGCVSQLSHPVTDAYATAGLQKAWSGTQRFCLHNVLPVQDLAQGSFSLLHHHPLPSPPPPHFLVPCMRFTAPRHVRLSSEPSLLLTQRGWGLQQIHTCTRHVAAICSQCSPHTFFVAHGPVASWTVQEQVPTSLCTGAASSPANAQWGRAMARWFLL